MVRVKELDEERRNAPRRNVNITTDFSWLREFLQNGGYVVTSFKCPNCGGGIEIPKEGETTKCGHCGSIVHAVDVIKMIKELIR